MSNPIEDGKILVRSNNKDLMIELRKAISANFEKVWIFIHCNNNTSYGIEVCNEWGSKLPEKKGEDVALFVNNWMKENS